MAFLFRGKFVCFYCGCKSAQTRTSKVRRWQCAHCEAENFLDENGEITDPPAEDVSSSAYSTQSLARPTSPVFETHDDSLFCPTCLKNQHLVSQALASYLPPSDAPDFAEYVKAENEYLKGLEERYPQVCKSCEPKVQEKIRAAGYAAKTDHLRRMMDRTRGYGIQYRDASWGSPLVTLGGVGWFLSLAGQVLWDGASLLKSTEEDHGLRDARESLSGSMCLQQVMRGSGSILDCTEILYSTAGLALLLGVLSSWWNPMLHETLRRKGGQAVGTAEFYQLQVMLLIVRCMTWCYLPSDLKVQMTKAAHLSLLVLTAVISVKSFRSVRMDHSAPVKFQDSPKPSVSQTTQQKASSVGTGALGYRAQQPNPSLTRKDGSIRPFSIVDLAPPNQQRPIYQSPTPPPDDDDNEAMDWTPSQDNKILRPAASYRISNAVSQQLQPAPYRQNLRSNALLSLRDPQNQPLFLKGPETRNLESFKTPMKYTMRDSSDESPFATPYEASPGAGSPELSPIKFAQPRFFPHTDREELGLESLMANNFSLAEQPHEVRARQKLYEKGEYETQSKLAGVYMQLRRPAALLLLAISCMAWTSTPIPSLAAFRVHLGLAALCIAAIVILKSLLPAVRKDSDRSLSDIVLLAFELITTIILGVALRQRAATSSPEDSIGPLETPGMILIAVLIAQEAWMLYSGTWIRRKSKGRASSPPVPQIAAGLEKTNLQQSFVGGSMSSSRHDPKDGIVTDSNGQHLPSLSQRTTRSRTKLGNDPSPGSFGSLSLGGNARNEQALGMNSVNLGQPQRRNRNGMW
ncbi:MAG: hypothetical protein ASARMPREDX12_004558 [Alectoria sarmentosa]|nr:MAG: hypothetical protein ASARMPREDX12_004558 [Alectoria sarmentosa]